MEKFLKIFEEWEKTSNYTNYPEVIICSDGSGRLMVEEDAENHTLFWFDRIDQLIQYFKDGTIK